MNLINKELMRVNNFTSMTKVQQEVMKVIDKTNRDLIVQAQTGTGKTHAFLFSALEVIDPELIETQTIIIAPTRELAMQIEEFSKPIKEIDPRYTIDLAIGGMDGNRLAKKIEKKPHIIIGTPGKILDLLQQNLLRLDTVKLCILDEMDMILDYGFIHDIDKIATLLTKQTRFMLFSATYPQGLKSFIKRYLNRPIEIVIEVDKRMGPDIDHILIHQKYRDEREVVLDVLGSIQPSLGIIFTNTIKQADSIYAYLKEYGVNCTVIHGDIDARRRKQILKLIQNKQVEYIIATDLAARGWDLPEISHVINVNLPSHDLSFYDHRVGRTGRSGRDGMAISIVNEEDKKALEKLISKGYSFKYKKPGKQTLNDTRPFMKKRPRHDSYDPEVAQVLNRKKVKVKPGYKKKRQQELEKIKSRKRRDMIRASIREQKKERAKKKALEKARDN